MFLLCFLAPPLPPTPNLLCCTALLSRELYGLREEVELRDFSDQLKTQIAAINAGANIGLQNGFVAGYKPQSSPERSSSATTGGTARSPYQVGGSATKERNGGASDYDEKEQHQSALLVQGLERAGGGGSGGQRYAAGGGRDISADLAAVRALQEQDRALMNAYSRGRPNLG